MALNIAPLAPFKSDTDKDIKVETKNLSVFYGKFGR